MVGFDGSHGRFEGERLKRVHKTIADAGSAGIDGNKLSGRTQVVDRRKRVDILAHLEEAGMVRVIEMAKVEGARGPLSGCILMWRELH